MNPSRCFDVVVIGLGAMGGAACWQLANRGCRVLGLDQFTPPHTLGSSHGRTRVIRTAYFEHPAYVPLVRRAFDRWYELEQLTGQHLLTSCPCLNLGPADGAMIRSLTACVRLHQLPARTLDAAEICRIFPPFHLPEHYTGILEDQAGFLAVEDCVAAQLAAARRAGAQLHLDEPVMQWEVEEGHFRIVTSPNVYYTARLVVTAGAWAARLLRRWNLPLGVLRQVMLWFDVGPRACDFRRDRFPIFIAETPAGDFYGLPAIDPRGLKAARHYGAPELPDPDVVDRQITPEDSLHVRRFLDDFLPGLGAVTEAQTCLYTVTPDRHFLIDRLTDDPPLVVAAGFSGHGFKFAPVVGEILADLVLDGQTPWDISLFRVQRFSCS